MANRKVLTNCLAMTLALTVVTAAIGISGCTVTVPTGEHHGSQVIKTSRGEHGRDGEGSGERVRDE